MSACLSSTSAAALLLTARRRWHVVIAAIVVGEVAVDLQHGLGLLVALGSAAANVVGAMYTRRLCQGQPDLTVRADLLKFVAGAVVLGPLAGGLIGASVIVAQHGSWWPGLVLQWLAGDGIAVLVIGAPILLWARRWPLLAAMWVRGRADSRRRGRARRGGLPVQPGVVHPVRARAGLGGTLWDVGVERQIEISGPDAFTFADMMTPRDLANCAVRASSCGVIPRGRG